MFKFIAEMLRTVARVAIIGTQVGVGLAGGAVSGMLGNTGNGRSFRQNWSDAKKQVKQAWYTTCRPKGYQRPLTEEEIQAKYEQESEVKMEVKHDAHVQARQESKAKSTAKCLEMMSTVDPEQHAYETARPRVQKKQVVQQTFNMS